MACEPTAMFIGQGNRGFPAEFSARSIAEPGENSGISSDDGDRGRGPNRSLSPQVSLKPAKLKTGEAMIAGSHQREYSFMILDAKNFQEAPDFLDVPVVIIGAGTVGLFLAASLAPSQADNKTRIFHGVLRHGWRNDRHSKTEHASKVNSYIANVFKANPNV
jgi:hypothetical protein